MRVSRQLTGYLRDRRAGMEWAEAAERNEINLVEAELHDAADAAGEYVEVDLTEPATAGCAVTTEENIGMATNDTDELAEMASDTLRGDVRDAMLSWFKATPKPWGQMSETEQRNLADAADRAARNLVRQACQIIAANERPCIVATLVEYREKDGVEAKLKLASKGEVVAALHEACGREVLVVTSGAEEVMGEAAEAEIDADQPDFPALGGEYDEAA